MSESVSPSPDPRDGSRSPSGSPAGGADGDDHRRRPLLFTDDVNVLDAVARLATAVGVHIDVAADAAEARVRWASAPLVIVGADRVAACLRAGMTPRPAVVLVSTDLDDAGVWEQGTRIGADRIVILPDADRWLAKALSAAAAHSVHPYGRAKVVGVLAGCGGAGATSLAVALALAAVRRGLRTALVDADPLGGGIDVALGAGSTPGRRWPELIDTGDPVPPGGPASALPTVGTLKVLAWAGIGPLRPTAGAMRTALRLLRADTDLIVVDLPRRDDDEAALATLRQAHLGLLVVPAEIRAVAAATRISRAVIGSCRDLRVVVRQRTTTRLSAETVADGLGLPLAGAIRNEPGLTEATNRGVPPGTNTAGPLATWCARFRACHASCVSRRCSRIEMPDVAVGKGH